MLQGRVIKPTADKLGNAPLGGRQHKVGAEGCGEPGALALGELPVADKLPKLGFDALKELSHTFPQALRFPRQHVPRE
jgi:hypothetical protein